MALFEDLATQGEESGRFQHAQAEMARLEELMRGVSDTGAALVARLQPGAAGGAALVARLQPGAAGGAARG